MILSSAATSIVGDGLLRVRAVVAQDALELGLGAGSLHMLLNSRSTNGPSPPLSSSIALPTRSWLVMAMRKTPYLERF